MADPAFQVSRVDPGDPEEAELRLSGRLCFRDASLLRRELRRLVEPLAPRIRVNLGGVETMDGGSTALLLDLLAELDRRGARAELVGAEGSVRRMLDLYRERGPSSRPRVPPSPTGFLAQVGAVTQEILEHLSGMLSFLGDVVAEGLASLENPRSIHWRDLGRLMVRTGFDALPIVVLIDFLVGLVTGFQAAVQLRQFGAEIYVADLVGLSITRELGPLMTAIIVAGRSGAAYAAELGTMRVSEEVDALSTLGLDRYRFLVFPRLLALVAVVPLLTLVGDAVGILGGLFVAITGLDLTPASYMVETRLAIDLVDVFSGVLKAFFFGGAIALLACQRGLAAEGGAEGVGRSTTSAVVTSLFFLILIDAGFTVLYHVFDV